MKKPEIQEYIQKRLKEKEDALIAKQDEVLKTLTAVMRREKPETVVVTCKARSYGSKMDKLCKCKQCKIALMCIDDILNERQFQTVECNDKVKRYYIEVRDRK